MNLSTIWTLPGMKLRERLIRTREWAWRKAAHLVPRRLAYWTLIDTGVRHIEPSEEVPAVPFTVILERAGKALR